MHPQDEQATTPQQPQPAAYDVEGRPLYYSPPAPPQSPSVGQQPVLNQSGEPTTASSHVTTQPSAYEGHNFDPQLRSQYANEPGVVHATRAIEPVVPHISEALQKKHEASKRRYPFLNLSEGEFVVMSIQRHPIGLFIPVALTCFLAIVVTSVLFLYPDLYVASPALLPSVLTMTVILLALLGLIILGGSIAVWVYLQNKFFLTNESVIQEIQYSLFSRHEQTVSLGSIEDASFKQYGIFPFLFNYGLLRLSTEGEETTYRFNFVARPKAQVAIVNNAVEAFKNGRPVGLEHLDS